MSTQQRKYIRRAALAGAVLALLCAALPPEYREPCRVLAAICTGGIP